MTSSFILNISAYQNNLMCRGSQKSLLLVGEIQVKTLRLIWNKNGPMTD